jgi:putative hemolysin
MRQTQGVLSSTRELLSDAAAYPACPEALPPRGLASRAYAARFARSGDELRALQRLRFDVFNLELGEGLAVSFDSGLDRDEYDSGCHHLIVTPADRPDTMVGTYRLQTSTMARRHAGFYSSSEFDLSALPAAVLDNAVELGRACIAARTGTRKC